MHLKKILTAVLIIVLLIVIVVWAYFTAKTDQNCAGCEACNYREINTECNILKFELENERIKKVHFASVLDSTMVFIIPISELADLQIEKNKSDLYLITESKIKAGSCTPYLIKISKQTAK
jgi:hypothetical protein